MADEFNVNGNISQISIVKDNSRMSAIRDNNCRFGATNFSLRFVP